MTHRSVMAAVGTVMDVIQRLMRSHPQAVHDPSITQISQRTWEDDIGVAYSEAVEVSVTFTDFQVMSQWIFTQPHDVVRVQRIDWSLSPDIENELKIALCVDAIRDARRKAETFAAAAGLTLTGIMSLSDSHPEEEDVEKPAPTEAPKSSPRQVEPTSSEIRITPSIIHTEVCVAAHFTAEAERIHDTFVREQK